IIVAARFAGSRRHGGSSSAGGRNSDAHRGGNNRGLLFALVNARIAEISGGSGALHAAHRLPVERLAGETSRRDARATQTRFPSLTVRYWLSTAAEMRDGSTSMQRAPRSRKRPRSNSRR